MGEFADRLGNKKNGELIRAQDWNQVVAEIEIRDQAINDRVSAFAEETQQNFDNVHNTIQQLSEEMTEQLAQTNNRLDNALEQIETLDNQLTEFRTKITNILGNYYRLTLRTESLRYALGKPAELVANIYDIEGNPINIADENQLPWIDFVVTWGHLRPAKGFDRFSTGGAGEKSISVRVNLKGEARVLIVADHADEISEEVEEEVDAVLNTRIGEPQQRIADTILNANTPAEVRNTGAFTLLKEEYDKTATTSMRKYVDTYYIKNAPRLSGRMVTPFIHRWRDYCTTILAFVKPDNTSTTPDPSMGASSIQMTFRDWIGPWIVGHYWQDLDIMVTDFRGRLGSKITADMKESLTNIKDEVNEFVRDKGVVAKQGRYAAVQKAIDQLEIADPPPFWSRLHQSVQEAVGIQRTMIIAQETLDDTKQQEVAFNVFTNASVQADTKVDSVQGRVDELQNTFGELQNTFDDMKGEVNTIQNDLVAMSGSVGNIDQKVDTLNALGTRVDVMEQQASVFQKYDVIDLSDKLTSITDMKTDITILKEQIGNS